MILLILGARFENIGRDGPERKRRTIISNSKNRKRTKRCHVYEESNGETIGTGEKKRDGIRLVIPVSKTSYIYQLVKPVVPVIKLVIIN